MNKKQNKNEDKCKCLSPWRLKIQEIIYEADTPAGKAFDIILLWLIVFSVIVVMLESVKEFQVKYEGLLVGLEWFFTILFTIEYLFRIISVHKPLKYMTSFFGIIDLLSILPTYLSLFFAGTQSLVVIRSIRLLRIFRILKIARYIEEAHALGAALRASRHKLVVFLAAVVSIVVIMGTMMYLIEARSNSEEFTSIPRSVYWAIVTLTTVGYGDISPKTPFGQAVASLIMILGYAIIAVPTGIVSAELTHKKSIITTKICPHCSREGHDYDATYCKYCAGDLEPEQNDTT